MTNQRNKLSGVVLLFGYFMVFCALLLFTAGAWRWIRDQRQVAWPVVTATISRCNTDVDHPFQRNGGGTIYSLRCRLGFDFDDSARAATVSTMSTRSEAVRDQIELWVRRHRSGSILQVKVNPRNAAEVVIQDQIPIQQRPTPGDGFRGGVVFGLLGMILSSIGWRLRLQGR